MPVTHIREILSHSFSLRCSFMMINEGQAWRCKELLRATTCAESKTFIGIGRINFYSLFSFQPLRMCIGQLCIRLLESACQMWVLWSLFRDERKAPWCVISIWVITSRHASMQVCLDRYSTRDSSEWWWQVECPYRLGIVVVCLCTKKASLFEADGEVMESKDS